MPETELEALLRLNRTEGLGCVGARLLYTKAGSAREVFLKADQFDNIIPGASHSLKQAMEDPGYDAFVRHEIEFMERHGIRCITMNDADYPARLMDCNDAPVMLFTLGNADLNAPRTVGIVGTRKATAYGCRMCRDLVNELGNLCPDCVIISGLALGIDVEAHRRALDNDMSTIAVLGHGLDMIYPRANRQIATGMLVKGGLVTEFPSGTIPFKQNFVRRNRIIAGMSDALVVVESAAKSGSLITAELAWSYNRECFAFPGSVGDPYSAGCNELIRDNRAALITSAMDLVTAMGWNRQHNEKEVVQKQLFPELSAQEKQVLDRIKLKAQGVYANSLIVDLNIPYSKLASIMLSLEMKGLAKMIQGSKCMLM